MTPTVALQTALEVLASGLQIERGPDYSPSSTLPPAAQDHRRVLAVHAFLRCSSPHAGGEGRTSLNSAGRAVARTRRGLIFSRGVLHTFSEYSVG